MKKMMLAVLISVAAFAARADVITNTVVIVSNFYSQAFIETVVTQKVKSSHTDYWFTNHVNTITHDTLIVSQTNLSVNVDVGRDFVIAASNQANRAASAVNDSRTYANASAGSASSAASSASAASSSASSAAATRNAAASECASALATINARINWFDQHSGETITQINITSNNYYAEDSVARSMADSAGVHAANNASAISSLQGGLATANGRIDANASAISSLQGGLATANGRINSNASAISSLQGNLSAVANLATNNQDGIAALSDKVDAIQLDRIVRIDPAHRIWDYKIYHYGELVITAHVHIWDRTVDGSSCYYLATYDRNPENASARSYSLRYVYKIPSTGFMYFTVVYNGTSYSLRMNETDTNPDHGVVGSSVAHYSQLAVEYVSDYVESAGFVSSDLNIYDARSNVVDRIVTTNDLASVKYETTVTEYLPGGDWNYEILGVGGNVVNTFTIKVDQGVIASAIDPAGYQRYQAIGAHGFYVSVRFKDGVYEVGLIGSSTADLTVKVWMPFYQRSDDWHLPPRGETAEAHTSTYLGYKVRFVSAGMSSVSNYTKFDPNKYDSSTGAAVDRVQFAADLIAFSNWVERVFQKK